MGIKLKLLKQDVAKMPRIPTYLDFDTKRTGCEEAGWYAVALDDRGIEVLSPLTICHGQDDIAFNKCKKACHGHNIYLGMNVEEIAIFWAGRIKSDLPK
ncbi:MAG: hypothetical protein ACC656_01255 [Candidatus Heimdallarchaeota archaeon]